MPRKGGGQVDGGSGFPHTAFLIGNCDDDAQSSSTSASLAIDDLEKHPKQLPLHRQIPCLTDNIRPLFVSGSSGGVCPLFFDP
jgi:hypothetical protein